MHMEEARNIDIKDENIRKPLIAALKKELILEQKRTGHPVRILSELSIERGDSRIDIVTVNGFLHGYEIKSDADTLERLDDQMNNYDKVFDKMTLVVGKKHIIRAINIVPAWWGIELVTRNSLGDIQFSTVRAPIMNPKQDKRALANLLWRQEALENLSDLGYNKGTSRMSRKEICDSLADRLNIDELRESVKKQLFYRQSWRVDQPLLQYGG